MKHFSEVLTGWYRLNKRDLPWRETRNPYYIWLSEIILQQTRVAQGTAYYHRFVEAFPEVSDLAQADNELVMKLWQGLGYYSRARNLQASARMIMTDHGGVFPDSYESLLKMKGVGDYTAAAIASFAYGLPHAVVDGNVYRVLSRIFGISAPIDSAAGKKEFQALADKLLDRNSPGIHNQALMEFGALHCKPAAPDCPSCPFTSSCFAYNKDQVDVLPYKEKKTKVRNRYFNYIVLEKDGKTVIRQRNAKDIWIELYDFPLLETESDLTEEMLIKGGHFKEFLLPGSVIRKVSSQHKHILSHQHIHARFWQISSVKDLHTLAPKGSVIVNQSELKRYAVPRLIERFLQEEGLVD
jgi:A/G-specific adenine glycosylase